MPIFYGAKISDQRYRFLGKVYMELDYAHSNYNFSHRPLSVQYRPN